MSLSSYKVCNLLFNYLRFRRARRDESFFLLGRKRSAVNKFWKKILKYYYFVSFLKILEKSIRSSLRNSFNKKGETMEKKEKHSNLNSWKQKTLIRRRQTTGSYADGTRQGRSRVSTVREDKMLVIQLLQNRRETVPQLKNWVHIEQCASIKKICKTRN